MEIPSHLMEQVRKARQLEQYSKNDQRAVAPMIRMYEAIIGQIGTHQYPAFYALICGTLGDVYTDTLASDGAYAMKQGIHYYQQALRFLSKTSHPEEYAMIQNNLGIAYSDLSEEDKTANLEKAIHCYKEVLSVRTSQPDPLAYADTHNNLGNAYFELPAGDRASNLQEAMHHYQEALRFYPAQTASSQHALMCANLGHIYLDLPTGDRASNLQKCIQYYQEALRFYTPKMEPLRYAGIQSNLGNVYLALPTGERNNNLKIAQRFYQEALRFITPQKALLEYATIQICLGNLSLSRSSDDIANDIKQALKYTQEALRILTPQNDYVKYMMAQNNLGECYRRLPMGNRADNLAQAMKYYQEALRFCTPQSHALFYAAVQSNLGNAYAETPRGDRAENLEHAIRCLQEALRFRTPDADPMMYAETQNNLGVAYLYRPTGDREANLEQAIHHFQEALRFRTPESNALTCARTQTNLGNAFSYRFMGDRLDNLDQAIQHYKEALRFYTMQNEPAGYALIQNDLGVAYWGLANNGQTHALSEAIHHFQEALCFYRPEIDPVKYADIQNNLGNVYGVLLHGERSANLSEAIHRYQEALRFYSPEREPLAYRRTARSLATLHFEQGAWEEALSMYRVAIRAGEQLYRAGLSTGSKTLEIKENAALYSNAAFAAVRCGETTEALLLLEQGKTRLLTEALRLGTPRPPHISDELWQRFEQTKERVRAMQEEKLFLPEEMRDPLRAYEDHVQAVQTANNAFDAVIQQIRVSAPRFLEVIDLSTIESAFLDSDTASITFCITTQGVLGFIVSWRPQLDIQIIELSGLTHADISRLFIERDAEGGVGKGWLEAYIQYLNAGQEPSTIRQAAFEQWQQTITHVLAVLGEHVMMPIISRLPETIMHIIIQPAAELFLVPLHAAPLFGDALQLVCDRYEVSYIPSMEVWLNTRARAAHDSSPSLYAAIHPNAGTPLKFAESEGEAVARLFKDTIMDRTSAATKKNAIRGVREKTYIHFSCHGSYDWDDPLLSGLFLTDGTLTLAELQQGVIDLSQARLVTLSACETGISDVFQGRSEEYVGVPAGFLVTGVPCVISSLWAVDDLSTTVLMERFYQNHIQKCLSIRAALREAQVWMRHATAEEMELERRWEQIYQRSHNTDTMALRARRYYRANPHTRPFAHPCFWAAMAVNGQ